MGFRFHRSIRLIPGVRLNLSKSGISTSFGVPGYRVNYGPRGKTKTVGLPGTGLSWRETSSGGRPKSRTSRSTSQTVQVEQPPLVRAVKPGWFAPASEKALVKALDSMTASSLANVAEQHPEVSATAATIAGIVSLTQTDDASLATAKKWLEFALDTGREPASELRARKYVNHANQMMVRVAEGVQAPVLPDRRGIALMLAELYQVDGDIDKAIDVIDDAQIDTVVAVSLCELFTLRQRFDEVIDLTDGVTNDDDATALLCVFRGIALREKDMYVAAREAFKEALRIRSRDTEIRNRAWIERAACYLAEGKRGMARNDLERIMAVDSDYPGLMDALANLDGEKPEETPETD